MSLTSLTATIQYNDEGVETEHEVKLVPVTTLPTEPTYCFLGVILMPNGEIRCGQILGSFDGLLGQDLHVLQYTPPLPPLRPDPRESA